MHGNNGLLVNRLGGGAHSYQAGYPGRYGHGSDQADASYQGAYYFLCYDFVVDNAAPRVVARNEQYEQWQRSARIGEYQRIDGSGYVVTANIGDTEEQLL